MAKQKRILITGGVACGPKAEITIVERGEFPSYAGEVQTRRYRVEYPLRTGFLTCFPARF